MGGLCSNRHLHLCFLMITVTVALLNLLFLIRPCPADEYPEVALNIKSVPTDWSITLTWTVPATIRPDKLVIVQKQEVFPKSPLDGKRIDIGPGLTAVDKDLVADTNYFYRFFLFDSAGNIMGSARHKEKT